MATRKVQTESKITASSTNRPPTLGPKTATPGGVYERRPALSQRTVLSESSPWIITHCGRWSCEEDRWLRASVKRHGETWWRVAREIPNRTEKQCAARWSIIAKLSSLDRTGEGENVEHGTVKKSQDEAVVRILARRRRRPIQAWTADEQIQLSQAIIRHGKKWRLIAKELPGRTQKDCYSRWWFVQKAGIRNGPWSAEEDQQLRVAIERHGSNSWQRVATDIPGRTSRQCRIRWMEHLAPGIRKGRWTVEECQKLKELVAEVGDNWAEIARRLSGKTRTQCRDKWRSTLMPGIRRGSWTEDEDELLREAVHRHGREWVKVAALVPGRSPRQCNSRWDITLNPDVRHTSWTLEEEERLLTAVQGRATDSSNFVMDWKRAARLVGTRSSVQCRLHYRSMERCGRTRLAAPSSDQSGAASGMSLADRIYGAYLEEQYGDEASVTPSSADDVHDADHGGEPSWVQLMCDDNRHDG